jgi:hypothetical protein
MKRLLALTMVLGLTAFGTGVAKANLLGNPDLDIVGAGDQVLATPIGGWHVVSSRSISGFFNDGASSEGFANVLQPGGFGLFFKAFSGQATDGKVSTELFQDRSAGAGVTYSLTGFAGAGAGYIGLTDPTVKSQFGLEFYDAAHTLIGTSHTIDLNTMGLGTLGAPAPFGYAQYTVSATAPAGTASVRGLAQQLNAYGNPAGGDQAFVVDSFSLVAPEPTSIVLGLIAAAGVFGLARRRS